MIFESYEQFITIRDISAETFQDKLNKATKDHARQQPKVDVEMNATDWRAVVRFTETVKIPEDIRDEYELRGIRYTCQDCPFFNLPADRRVKFTYCEQSDRRCDKASPACVWLYKKIESGEVVL